MSRYFLLFISLIVIAFSASAQEEIKVKGRISDPASKEPVPYVNIINKAAGKGTSSNVYGQFNLNVRAGDTLIFSAVGYGKQSLVIKEKLKEKSIQIYLDTEAMELKPARVFAYRDLESLKRAIVNMDMPLQNNEGLVLNLPKVTAQPQVNSDGEISGGAVITGALTGAINSLGLNKEYKQLQKLNQFRKEDNRRKLAQMKYNPKVVNEWTRLKGEKLMSFMEFCKLSDDFIIKSSEYELALVVQQCLSDFIEQEG